MITIEEINNYLKRLFPINRSITGEGNRETLKILNEIIPVPIYNIDSGKKCYDWNIPPEWNVENAWIKDSMGNTIVNFKNNNLHLMSYSIPINNVFTFKQLDKHLYYLKNKPNAIPYRTSYYKRDWGFCLSYEQYKKLKKDELYYVYINSNFNNNGKMVYGEDIIEGNTKEEILLSTYMCHPSLANDNLSGMLLSYLLFKELSNMNNLKYTYRLLVIPETIGAINWLSSYFVKNIKCGFVITCVAGPDKLGYKETFLKNHEIDKAVYYALRNKDYIKYKFEPIGSDERQYSSPGFRIPMGTITKSKYYEYDEYHTSLDNLSFISAENLKETLNVYLKAIYYLENNIIYRKKIYECEFMLSKINNIYPNTGGLISQPSFVKNHKNHNYTDNTNGKMLNSISWLMFGCDGKNSIFDIQEESGIDIDDLIKAARILKINGYLI